MPILLAEDSRPSASGPGGRRIAGDVDEDMAAAAVGVWGVCGRGADDERRERREELSGPAKCESVAEIRPISA
jgi:hypothetical protein